MRNLFLLTYLFASSLLSFNTLATKLTIPEAFDVLKVDGKEYSGSIFSDDTILVLTEGEHSIELKYNELFENDDGDDHAFIKSKPFRIVFTISTHQDLLLSKPDFDNEDAARIYADKPTVKIGNSKQNMALVTAEKISKENTMKTSFLSAPSAGITQTATTHITTPTQDNTSQAIKKVTNISNANVSLEKLAMLKYWWQQASTTERAEFKKFISQTRK